MTNTPTSTFDQRFKSKLEDYNRNYNLDDLNDANDRTLINIMVKTELMIEDLQAQIQSLIEEDSVTYAGEIKKLADLLRDATNSITTVQKTLAIDRKTRKEESSGSVADYIAALTKSAKAFVDERLSHVYCPSCNVMVGRFSPVHTHTAFVVSFQCSQCGKSVRVKRDERDRMHDISKVDRAWRRKYTAEIIQPRKLSRNTNSTKNNNSDGSDDYDSSPVDYTQLNGSDSLVIDFENDTLASETPNYTLEKDLEL